MYLNNNTRINSIKWTHNEFLVSECNFQRHEKYLLKSRSKKYMDFRGLSNRRPAPRNPTRTQIDGFRQLVYGSGSWSVPK